MLIENAKYVNDKITNTNQSVTATINGKQWSVPMSADNTFYAEILKQVDAGDITIADAD
jgi:hypothetical protein|tara:strand:- start:4 stop:180 length:177 start_codon:yes stop_codon:yes gene_type:complete